jgi:hypothetical protein
VALPSYGRLLIARVPSEVEPASVRYGQSRLALNEPREALKSTLEAVDDAEGRQLLNSHSSPEVLEVARWEVRVEDRKTPGVGNGGPRCVIHRVGDSWIVSNQRVRSGVRAYEIVAGPDAWG